MQYIQHLGVVKKLGMTRIFSQEEKNIPVTVLSWQSAYILDIDKQAKQVKIAYQTKKHPAKPMLGQLKKAGIQTKLAKIKSFPIKDDFSFKPGERLTLDQFKPNDKLTAVSISKGKGFSGVIKRHGFSRGPESHGSHHHRAPGSIGSMYPQRVIAGRKMPGQTGYQKRTIKNISVIDIDTKRNLIIVKGSISGAKGSQIFIFN